MKIDLPADLKLLGRVSDEIESRIPLKSGMDVIRYQPSSEDPDDQLAWPGSVVVYLTRKNSPLFKKICAAANGLEGCDAELAQQLREQSAGRVQIPLEDAVDQAIKRDNLVEIRYLGKSVASNFYIPDDADFITAVLPYTGGPLAPNGFEIIQNVTSDDVAPYEAVAVAALPELSEAEAAALARVPHNQLEIHVGKMFFCFALTAVVVVATLTLAGICGSGKKKPKKTPKKAAKPEKTSSYVLDPMETAAELIKKRRDALLCS